MALSKDTKELYELAKRQLKLEKDAIKFEEKSKQAKKDLLELTEITFPEKMRRCEITDITIKGKRIELIGDFRCNLPTPGGIDKAKGEQRQKLLDRVKNGMEWIKENDHGGIIKCKLIFEFGKGEEDLIKRFKTKTNKSFPKVELRENEAIHPATLKAFVREILEKGVTDFPKEAFAVTEFTKVRITEEE